MNLSGFLRGRLKWVVSGALLLPVSAQPQSEKDCQEASRLHAEAEVIQELFNNNWKAAKDAGMAAIGGRDESGRVNSLQTLIRDELKACQSGAIKTDACGNYKRIRDAEFGANPPGGGPGAEMGTDPQTCKIHPPKTVTLDDGTRREVPDRSIELTLADAPAGGVERARWMRAFRHEQFHQNNCRSLNGPGSNYDPNDWSTPSPYLQKMQDHRLHAEEEVYAYEITQNELEKYLEANCFDPELKVDVDDMAGKCGESPDGMARLRSLTSRAKNVLVNTMSDWLTVGVTEPLSVPPNGTAPVPLKGSCNCCNGTTKDGEVRVYGGPGHSVLVGKGPVKMGCAAKERYGGMSGDPHMRTYDGLAYDFQGFGEFVLARAEEFEVQGRMQPSNDQPVTVATAVAARLRGDQVALYAGKPVRLKVLGSAVPLDVGGVMRLPGGGVLTRDSKLYRLASVDGFVLEVRPGNGNLSVRVGIPPNVPSAGLLGSFDGDHTNDLLTMAGEVLRRPLDFETLYRKFGDDWRVTAADTLFDYALGQSPETIGDRIFPPRSAHATSISPGARRKAEDVCRRAGVDDGINLEDCVLDVALTGEEEFAQIAAEQPKALARLETASHDGAEKGISSRRPELPSASGAGVTMQGPRRALASFTFEVGISGPARTGQIVCVASIGSPDSRWVTMAGVRDGAQEPMQLIELIAPVESGNYELRYLTKDDGIRAQIRLPIEIADPTAHIEAPEFAPAGGKVDASCVGECSTHANLTVVPVGSPDDLMGPHAYLSQRTDVTILRLPKEPGEYEIRYVTRRQPRRVFARKRLLLR